MSASGLFSCAGLDMTSSISRKPQTNRNVLSGAPESPKLTEISFRVLPKALNG